MALNKWKCKLCGANVISPETILVRASLTQKLSDILSAVIGADTTMPPVNEMVDNIARKDGLDICAACLATMPMDVEEKLVSKIQDVGFDAIDSLWTWTELDKERR